MSLKHYLIELIHECGDEDCMQEDAVEFAILSDWVSLSYRKDEDILKIRSQIDSIKRRFAVECERNHERKKGETVFQGSGCHNASCG